MQQQNKDISFSEALSERYLSYALSTIMSRSLPDVRDGLKPVHRRIIYAMSELRLDPKSAYKKSARIVGDVIGKYHPHGDTAAYDALVRLAQEFSVRYPLIDGQGNFGSVDGDNAAAMRYTEARLTDIAMLLLQDINANTVDFRKNYDGSEEEPVIFPSAFPNLLANGSEGIAVGMATSIPPHNLTELCDALLLLIRDKNAVNLPVIAPDFPTGGVIIDNPSNIKKIYETGRGSVRVRAKWLDEQLPFGQYQIIITEIPYQVQKSRLIEKIAELFRDKKLPLIANIRDESAENIRVIIEPRNRTIPASAVMESLFKLTELEVRYNVNLNMLDLDGIPRVMNLREILQSFLIHRIEILTRRTNFRLEKISARLEILAGLLIAYLNLDEVIRIIREEDEPKSIMIAKWNLTENQAEAILNMRLRNLRKLEEFEIKGEFDELKKEEELLKNLLMDEKLQWKEITKEIKEIKSKFGDERRTALEEIAEDASREYIELESIIEREPITVICSKMGWIRSVKGLINKDEVKYKEGDGEKFIIACSSADKLLAFAEDGRCFTISCDKIPRGKGFGEPLKLHIDLESEVIALFPFSPLKEILLISHVGKGFRIAQEDIISSTKLGRQVMTGRLFVCLQIEVEDHIAIIGQNRKLLVFPLAEIPVMKKGQGVTLQKYKDGNIADAKLFAMGEGLYWKNGSREKYEKDLREWIGKRAGIGRFPPNGFPKNNRFVFD